MSASKSKIAANRRYRDKTYDQLSVAVLKGKRDEYKQAAEARNLSLAGLVQLSIDEYIKNNPVEEKEK